MNTHFAAAFKGTGPTTFLCRQYAVVRSFGNTTTDQAKVTCKACAKALGIAPALKQNTSGNPDGTCQCCFGQFKVVGGKIALHGYQRPGIGFILGRCRGALALPLEQSCELTIQFAGELLGALATNLSQLDDLHADKIDSFSVQVTDWDAPRLAYGKRQMKWVEVVRGQESSGFQLRIPSFKSIRFSRIGQLQSNSRGLISNIATLHKVAREWKAPAAA